MSVCPKFLHIRNSSNSNDTLSDRIVLENATSFGIKEFIVNIPKKLDIQCLFCSEFEPLLCNEQWFDKEADVKICKEIKSNFHLCLKLIGNSNSFYVYFQQRSQMEDVDVSSIVSELKEIYTINKDVSNNIFVIILLCGQPVCGTEIIAKKKDEFKNQFGNSKIGFYMKDIFLGSTTLTISEGSANPSDPYCINIEGSSDDKS